MPLQQGKSWLSAAAQDHWCLWLQSGYCTSECRVHVWPQPHLSIHLLVSPRTLSAYVCPEKKDPACHNHPHLCIYRALCSWEDTMVWSEPVTSIIHLVRLGIILIPFPPAVFLSHLSGKPPSIGSPDNPANPVLTLALANSCWNITQPLLNGFQAGSAMCLSHS